MSQPYVGTEGWLSGRAINFRQRPSAVARVYGFAWFDSRPFHSPSRNRPSSEVSEAPQSAVSDGSLIKNYGTAESWN